MYREHEIRRALIECLLAYYRRHGRYPEQVEVAPELLLSLSARSILMPNPSFSVGSMGLAFGDTLMPTGSLIGFPQIAIPIRPRGDWIWREGQVILHCPDIPSSGRLALLLSKTVSVSFALFGKICFYLKRYLVMR